MVLIPAFFFLAIAPTLPWLQFAGGSENLVIETVLEMRRGGPWFVPTLQGKPRDAKPPLTAWVTAAAARPDTVARLSGIDRAARDAAFESFAFQARWPTLLSACVMLAAAAALGDLLLGRPGGAAAALACGSSLMFLRFSRSVTTDVQLALWVTVCNAFLALAIFRRRAWLGYVGAGAALGLAMMSKGPVALVQTVVPFGAFLVWRRLFTPRAAAQDSSPNLRDRAWPAITSGLVVMLLIGLPWYLHIAWQRPVVLGAWLKEVTREGATQLARDPWYTYLVFFVWLPPALPFVIGGLWTAALALRPRDGHGHAASGAYVPGDGVVLALCLTLVPIVVMSFFKDKPERYLLPMLPPAAVLAAGAAVNWFRSDRRDPGGRVMEFVYWATLVAFAIGAPVLCVLAPRFDLGQRWASPAVAAGAGVAALALVAAGFATARAATRRDDQARAVLTTLATGAAVLLLLQYPVMRGYSRYATSDLKPLADLVWEKYPDARIYEYQPAARTRTYYDLPIYAGRTTSTRTDLASLQPDDRPVVVVFLSRRGDVPPLPARWQPLASGGGRKDSWQAYVLPARGD